MTVQAKRAKGSLSDLFGRCDRSRFAAWWFAHSGRILIYGLA